MVTRAVSQKNAPTTLLTAVLFVGAFFAMYFLLFTSIVNAEYIESFVSEIEIKEDSSFIVTEEIQYVFTEPKHGIYRCIPKEHNEKASSILKRRFIEIEFQKISMDGINVPFVVDEEKDSICVKIGESSATITDKHIYRIEYTVHGAVSYLLNGGADLYWNVTGTEWAVPMKNVVARVSSPDDILLRERACYFGSEIKSLSCAVSESDGVITFAGANLNPHEGLTISQALNRSVIAEDVREEYNSLLFALIGGMLSILILIIYTYRHRTAHKTDNAIIAQYEPYAQIRPMEMGVLFDGKLHARDVSAGFVYLAQQGYVRIKNIHKKAFFFFEVEDYQITLVKLPEESQDSFEVQLLSLIFSNSISLGEEVKLSEIKQNTNKVRENAIQLKKIEGSITASLLKHGFYRGGDFFTFVKRPLILISALLAAICAFLLNISLVFVIACFCIAFVFMSSPRRTKLGYEAKEYLEGFKDFLSVTEAQRYIFHNAPERNAEHFMEFLPYAIAFGVEKQWVKAFEVISIPSPSWYEDSRGINSFAPLSFTESISGFSNSLASSTQSSSLSGGGSVGGGAGGGGGGSW